MHRRHVEFRSGDTEDACLRRTRAVVERGVGDYFATLLDAWKHVAYAGYPLEPAVGRQLCADWKRHFDNEVRAQSSEPAGATS